MRVRVLVLAVALGLSAPVAVQAADMAGYIPGPSCAGLEPIDTYVPPQVAYIVACTVPLPPRVVQLDPPKKNHGFFGKHFFGHHGDEVVAVREPGPYGPHATHDPARYEGKLVYLKQWSADRPPVHFLVVPK
jgi:hypothetical protein